MSLRETTPALIRTFWPVCLIPSNARQEGEPARLPSTPLPLGLAGLDHHRQASPNPAHRRSTKCLGARSGNPKLFPPDGLGVGASGGTPPMGAGGGIELPV